MTRKQFDLLVFDWDGTLMDSAATIVDSIQKSAQDLGYPVPSDAQARHVIGLGLSQALAHAVPELPESRYDEMVERYRHHYLSRDHDLDLFAGVEEMLQELADAGFLLAVATGKSRIGLDRALDHAGLRPYFEITRCADECFSKPHPQMLLEIMAEMQVAPERTVMIGDTTHDLQLAQNAGTPALAMTHGAHPVDLLVKHQPLALLDSIADLRQWLRLHG